MARLTTAGLRWASGLFLAVLGAMMLVTPHQFNSPIYDALRPFLGLVGIAFLITGIALIALGSFHVHRAVDRTVHVLAGIELLILTAALAAAHSWTGTANFVALALGTLAAAFLAGRSDKSHSGNSANLLMLTVATGAGLAGLVMIVAPGIFSSRIFDTFRAFMFWVALAFLIGGLALAYVQLPPRVPRLVYWLGHLACGSAFLWFFFVSALPLHAWIGMIYYAGFGLMILSFPALEPRLRRIDPASLEVRLAMAMGAATTVALVVAVALTAGLVFGSSATGAAEAALRTARDISFIVLVVIVAMVVTAGILLARYFAKPLEGLARAADRLAGGDNLAPLPTSDVTEVAHLAGTFGEMRERLTARTMEREKLLAQVQEEKDRLSALVNSITDEVWFADTQKRFTLTNPSALHAFGFETAGDGIDVQKLASSLEVLGPDGSPRPVEEAPPLRALRGEVLRNLEEIIRTPGSGHLRYRQVSASPVRDASGEIIGSVAVVRDVTEQKRAEEELRHSEERFHSVFSSNVVALGIWDARGNLLDANDRFLRLIGYSREEFEAGQVRWDEATPAELRQQDYDAVVKLQAGQEIEPYEKEFVRPDGTRVPVLIGGAMLPGITDVGIAFAVDITERKVAEEELRRSENRLRVLIENVNAGMALIDETGRFSAYNSQFLKMFGLSPDSDIKNVNDQDWGAWQVFDEAGEMLHVDEHPVRKATLSCREVRDKLVGVRLPEGHNITWMLVSAVPLFDTNGRVESVICTYSDLTERRKAEEERERLLERVQSQNEKLQALAEENQSQNEELLVANKELLAATAAAQEAVRARDEFLSIASHELKTPLTSLLGHTQLLERRLSKSGSLDVEKARHAMSTIGQQSIKLANLINQLLDVSRIESGKLTLDCVPSDITALVEMVVNDARSRGVENEIIVNSPGQVEANVDPLRLEQVFTNLIDNAVKYGRDSEAIEVDISRPDEASVGISVTDHGDGVAPEDREHLFNRFYQAQRRYPLGGLGLGLYISKEIVELHGGSIRAEFPDEGGTKFVVALPVDGCQGSPTEQEEKPVSGQREPAEASEA